MLPDGTVLDSAGFVIDTISSDRDPDVTFDGTNYFVAWAADGRSPNPSDIYGARVSQSGVVLDPLGIRISRRGYVWTPRVFFSQGLFQVLWWNYSDDSLLGGQVTPAGAVVDTVPRLLYFGPYTTRPEVACNGLNCLLVTGSYRSYINTVNSARLDVSGQPIDSVLRPLAWSSSYRTSPAVTSNGNDFLVVWTDHRGTDWDIYGSRVSAAGEVLDGSGFAICSDPGDQTQPAVASDGTNYLVVWTSSGGAGVFGARVSPQGIVLDPEGFRVESLGADPRVAFDGVYYFAAWARRGRASCRADYRSGCSCRYDAVWHVEQRQGH